MYDTKLWPKPLWNIEIIDGIINIVIGMHLK